MTKTKLTIGLYGGMANSTYVFAKHLHQQGYNVLAVRDSRNTFPFSQPVWEDVRFTLDYEDVNKPYTVDDWVRFEQERGWQAPRWLFNPITPSDPHSPEAQLPPLDSFLYHRMLKWWGFLPSVTSTTHSPKVQLPPLDSFLYHRMLNWWGYLKTALATLQQADVLLVCGVDGELLAYASGKPYIIWPHGSDVSIAIDKYSLPDPTLKKRLIYVIIRHLVKNAFANAAKIASHAPEASSGDIDRFLSKFGITQMGMPTHISPRMPKAQRRQKLQQVCDEIGIPVPQADIIAFVPSRIDYYWKGTDRLLRAIQSDPRISDHVHLIFSGWGADYPAARKTLSPQQATFLPFAVSKPILHDLYQGVDLVIDQFHMEVYGASFVEAAGRGTPVMININEDHFRRVGWEAPPVINVQTEDDIRVALLKIVEDESVLDRSAAQLWEWVQGHHTPQVICQRLDAILDDLFIQRQQQEG